MAARAPASYTRNTKSSVNASLYVLSSLATVFLYFINNYEEPNVNNDVKFWKYWKFLKCINNLILHLIYNYIKK